jgi:aminoglycoside phosphotransferase (APT) family kinase protein
VKFNNVIVDESGENILALLDWELATIGDPLLDVALMWAATWGTTRAEFGGIRDVDLAAHALPSAAAYEADYVAAGGQLGGLSKFYRVLALLRCAGIFHGIGQRAAVGAASSSDATERGLLGEVYFQRALEAVDEDW